MVMEKVRSHLESLSKLAPQLNKATDLYMDELKEIEEQLNSLNLGTEVELEGFVQEAIYKSLFKNGELTKVDYPAWSLGYGKSNRGNWCLFIREYTITTDTSSSDPHPSDVVGEGITPLLEASRDLRLAAAEQIPDLLIAIEEAVKAKIEKLRKISDKH